MKDSAEEEDDEEEVVSVSEVDGKQDTDVVEGGVTSGSDPSNWDPIEIQRGLGPVDSGRDTGDSTSKDGSVEIETSSGDTEEGVTSGNDAPADMNVGKGRDQTKKPQ